MKKSRVSYLNTLFLLDVAECAMSEARQPGHKSRVRATAVAQRLMAYNPFVYAGVSTDEVAGGIKLLFPAYRNRRRRTRLFKVSRSALERTLSQHEMTLRPHSHALSAKG